MKRSMPTIRPPSDGKVGHDGQGGDQGHEAAAGDAGRTLGRQQHDAEHGGNLTEGQVDVAGLGDEERRQGQVDRGAVQVEGIAHRQHQTRHTLLAASVSSFCRMRGRTGSDEGAEHDQQLLAEVAQQRG